MELDPAWSLDGFPDRGRIRDYHSSKGTLLAVASYILYRHLPNLSFEATVMLGFSTLTKPLASPTLNSAWWGTTNTPRGRPAERAAADRFRPDM